MNVVICKIISGDFVIGKLESKIDPSDKTEKTIIPILIDVYNLIIQPDPKNPQQLRTLMIPIMMPFDDKAIKELSVDKFVLSTVPAPEEVYRTYIKLTTGLDLAPSGSKIIIQ
jgi:hypothetical protein